MSPIIYNLCAPGGIQYTQQIVSYKIEQFQVKGLFHVCSSSYAIQTASIPCGSSNADWLAAEFVCN